MNRAIADGSDHPRIRGEHRPHGAEDDDPSGIIPAYAGSTEANSLDGQTMADHPRIRGEHPERSGSRRPAPGSSPHTRGALDCSIYFTNFPRIIPAYAGSTKPPGVSFRGVSDHPRIRGEHDAHVGSDATYPGSSPHTRGALVE